MALLTTTQSSKELKKMRLTLLGEYRRVLAKPSSYYEELKRLNKEIMVAEKLEEFRNKKLNK